MRVGIVGTGTTFGIADWHAAAFGRIPEAEITAVFTRRKEQGENFVRRHGLEAVVCQTYEELLEQVDGVCICSPNDTHASYAIKALQNGKGVLCEKPVEGIEEELCILEGLAQKKKNGHMVGFNYRYSWENRALRQIVQEGRLGQIYTFYQRKGGNRLADKNVPFEWRMDNNKSRMGAAIDFGSHMLDNFLYIGGYDPEEVSVVLAQTEIHIAQRTDLQKQVHKVSTDDTAVLILNMKDKSRAVLDCSRIGVGFEEIQIVGSKGVVSYTQVTPDRIYFWKVNEGGSLETVPQIFQKEKTGEEDTYYLQACDWVKAVMEGTQLSCNLELGCREAFLFRWIAQSAEEKRYVRVKKE